MTVTQPWPMPPPARTWPTAGLAILAVVLAVASLIVALTRPGPGLDTSYSTTQKAEAKAKLCSQYKLASQAVGVETNVTDNVALARISDTNGALILWVASMEPALDSEFRNAAQDLALAYQTVVAVSSSKAVDDPQFRAAIEDSNARDRVMMGLCGD